MKIYAAAAALTVAASLGTVGTAHAATPVQHCTGPAVISGGFVQLTCFPDVPHNVFPAGKKCENESYWATGTKHVTLHGRKYVVTQTIRETIRVCPA